ncbi:MULTISPECIES: hypothetical protein [unclassified Streptomyces]|uniref:hypothetical protein n=1 Tax=unclassified Streptomyces TaxID=2593676 RepID=UPI002E2BF533|nr:hypothetical protein [Streptomyces sp. NBC_01429]
MRSCGSDVCASDDRCAVCDRVGAADESSWSLLSCHTTSEGMVEYCVCRCGTVAVLTDGRITKVFGARDRRAAGKGAPTG